MDTDLNKIRSSKIQSLNIIMLKKLYSKVRSYTFPTTLDRWYLDRGDETLRLDYPITTESVVLDFGGYEGQWAESIRQRFDCNIIIFEAVPEYAEKISRRFTQNDKIEVCAYGLGKGSRTEKIYMGNDASSSHNKSGIGVDMRVLDAVEWLETRGNPNVSLAKINIEGGEYELLECLIDAVLIHLFDHLQIQFHKIAPDSPARREKIQMELSKTHDLVWSYEFVWESWKLR